jgi:hypothetical protein
MAVGLRAFVASDAYVYSWWMLGWLLSTAVFKTFPLLNVDVEPGETVDNCQRAARRHEAL